EMIARYLRRETDPRERLDLQTKWAKELLQSGQSEQALRQFQAAEAMARRMNPPLAGVDLIPYQLGQALSYMRIGEQENCLLNHTADACLFPLRPGGFHKLPRGSRGAIPLLESILGVKPDDLRARWLLNIAHMTLGEYPEKVSAPW